MKRGLVWVILMATLVAVYFAPGDDDAEAGVVTPTKIAPDAISTHAAVQRIEPVEARPIDLGIRPRKAGQDLGNVFASHAWTPPPAKAGVTAVAAPAPAQPEAPPLPFRFLGRLVDDGKTAYFLQLNDRNLVLHLGDTVDNTYTLESSSGGNLTFAYLPLNTKQTLAVGELN